MLLFFLNNLKSSWGPLGSLLRHHSGPRAPLLRTDDLYCYARPDIIEGTVWKMYPKWIHTPITFKILFKKSAWEYKRIRVYEMWVFILIWLSKITRARELFRKKKILLLLKHPDIFFYIILNIIYAFVIVPIQMQLVCPPAGQRWILWSEITFDW